MHNPLILPNAEPRWRPQRPVWGGGGAGVGTGGLLLGEGRLVLEICEGTV